jgi:AcrR family transcriptional regulator
VAGQEPATLPAGRDQAPAPDEETHGSPANTGRRRGPALQRAIFDAVFDQIQAVGYARLTMDRVMVAAGTSKAVLYRRWDNKEALVLDALRESMPAMPDIPAQPTLREDLLVLLGALRSTLVAADGIAFHLVAAEVGGDCRAMVNERVFAPAHQAVLDALRRAADRGETDEALVTDLIADIGPALLRSRAMDGSALPDALVVAITDEVLIPLLAPAVRRRRSAY